jgi:tRNA(fMet)-specific endonuclease VapC
MGQTAYLLDTNIITALVRNPHGPVFDRLREKLPAVICTSIVAAAEVECGLCKGVSDRLRAQVLAVMGSLDVRALETPVHQHYGKIRAYLTQRGQPIGPNDLLIAAHASALGMTLVTDKLREFERVPGLKLENWLVAAY